MSADHCDVDLQDARYAQYGPLQGPPESSWVREPLDGRVRDLSQLGCGVLVRGCGACRRRRRSLNGGSNCPTQTLGIDPFDAFVRSGTLDRAFESNRIDIQLDSAGTHLLLALEPGQQGCDEK